MHAHITPGNLTHDLVCVASVGLAQRLIAPAYSQLTAKHSDSPAPTYCTCVTVCIHVLSAWSETISCSLPVGMCMPKAEWKGGEIQGLRLKADCSSARGFWFELWYLTFDPQIADTQQFFTGKLYVPVHTLKLPAEELLWSALHHMTQVEEVHWERERGKEGRRCSVNSVSTLEFNDLQHLHSLNVYIKETFILCSGLCAIINSVLFQ